MDTAALEEHITRLDQANEQREQQIRLLKKQIKEDYRLKKQLEQSLKRRKEWDANTENK